MSQTVWVNGESQEVVALVQNVEFIRKAIDNIFERIFVVVRVHSHLTSSIHERLQYLPYYNRNVYKIINTINEDAKCSNTRLVAQAASKSNITCNIYTYTMVFTSCPALPHKFIHGHHMFAYRRIGCERLPVHLASAYNCLKSWRV